MASVDVCNEIDRATLELSIKRVYSQVAIEPYGQYHFEVGKRLAERLGYPDPVLKTIPAEAIESFAGVGYFFHLAGIAQGEFVVDLGSGSGTDTFAASVMTGGTGRVVGIDMTPEQLQKAHRLRCRFGYSNISFRRGYLEQVPLPDHFADVVISNGVFNLSGDKMQVFREACRILKPGGRLVISDITSSVDLPVKIKCDPALWASCIGGAVTLNSYEEMICASGMRVIQTGDNPQYRFLSKSATSATKEFGIKSISLLAMK